ncbi:threonine/serine exporter family protein [Bacillus sp. FJAT-42315]|uniref:threonine/serine exporter family protein n=1 Tax=Bacillus sp. FJAT-42315 TaxID=2014077 RepID=UPI000C249324|nr:threonine/serine exporter family protein [Bacillus sp. FJAT-42315]
MDIVVQLVTSFIAAAAFGIIFNAPKESLLTSGFVGMIGWIVYYLFWKEGVNAVLSTGISAFVIAIISHVYSKRYKMPIIIFTVAGIIPLVPGGISYNAMRSFVQNDYNTALTLAAKAFMISGAIAMGLIVSEVLRTIPNRKKK